MILMLASCLLIVDEHPVVEVTSLDLRSDQRRDIFVDDLRYRYRSLFLGVVDTSEDADGWTEELCVDGSYCHDGDGLFSLFEVDGDGEVVDEARATRVPVATATYVLLDEDGRCFTWGHDRRYFTDGWACEHARLRNGAFDALLTEDGARHTTCGQYDDLGVERGIRDGKQDFRYRFLPSDPGTYTLTLHGAVSIEVEDAWNGDYRSLEDGGSIDVLVEPGREDYPLTLDLRGDCADFEIEVTPSRSIEPGPPPEVDVAWSGDVLHVDVYDPLGRTSWELGIAETAAESPDPWTGEDCWRGYSPFSYCHPLESTATTLLPVTSPDQITEGFTTLFDASMSPTYLLRDPDGGSCWVWGQDRSYYDGLDCAPLPMDACDTESTFVMPPATTLETYSANTCGAQDDTTPTCGPNGDDYAFRFVAPEDGTYVFTGSGAVTSIELREGCPSPRVTCGDATAPLTRAMSAGEAVVVGLESGHGCGNVWLDVWFEEAACVWDPYAPNHTPSQAEFIGDAVLSASLVFEQDEDWFEVDVGANTRCTLEADGDPGIEMLQEVPGIGVVASPTVSFESSSDSRERFGVGRGTAARCTTYVLHGTCEDCLEPDAGNDSIASATPLTNGSGSLGDASNLDYYLLGMLQPGGTVTADVQFVHADGDIDADLYLSGEPDPVHSSGTVTDDEHVQYTLDGSLPAQQVYLRVAVFNGPTDSCLGTNYTFTSQITP